MLLEKVEPLTNRELLTMPTAPALKPILFVNVEFRIARLEDSIACMAPAGNFKLAYHISSFSLKASPLKSLEMSNIYINIAAI